MLISDWSADVCSSDLASFVRNGSAQASVEVVIDSGSGHSIHVTRTLRETYKSRVATELSIDGLSEPTDAALSLWLQSSFGFDQSTLSRLCFLAEGGVLASTQDSRSAERRLGKDGVSKGK